MSNTVAIA